MTQNVLILGAGMTGLAAAWKILQTDSDCRVTLLERDAVPGGLAKSIPWHGFYLDLGPHRFHTEIPEIKEFIKTFCQERMARVPRYSRMYLNGRYIPYPISPVQTFRALGMAQTLSFMASAVGVLLRGGAGDAVSYEDYVTRYYGKSLYRSIFKPFAEKVWGLPPSRIAAETARVRLRGDSIWHALKDSFLSSEQTYVAEFLYPRHGMGEIAHQFAGEIIARGGTILYQHTVRDVERQDGRVTAVRAETPDGVREFACDVLVNTIPLPRFVPLLRPAAGAEAAAAAASLRYRALVLLYLLYEGDLPVKDTWLYYPEEHVPFSRISVPGNFLPARDRNGKTSFCVEFTCEVDDPIWRAAPRELAGRAEEVMRRSGLIDQAAADCLTVHIRDGYPVYHVQYEESLHTVLNFCRSLQNCITTGRQGLFRHNNIDQAIQMGLHTAEHILHRPQAISDWYDGVDRFKDYRIVD